MFETRHKKTVKESARRPLSLARAVLLFVGFFLVVGSLSWRHWRAERHLEIDASFGLLGLVTEPAAHIGQDAVLATTAGEVLLLRGGSQQPEVLRVLRGLAPGAPIALPDSFLLATQEGSVYRLGYNEGKVLWVSQLGENITGELAVTEKAVFVLSETRLLALSPGSGESLAQARLPAAATCGPVLWQGRVLVGCERIGLVAYDPETLQPILSAQVAAGSVGQLAVLGDTAFVTDSDGALSLWQVPGEPLAPLAGVPAVTGQLVPAAGSVLAVCGTRMLAIAAGGQVLWESPLGRSCNVAVSSEGKRALLACPVGRLTLLDTATGRELKQGLTGSRPFAAGFLGSGQLYVASIDRRLDLVSFKGEGSL